MTYEPGAPTYPPVGDLPPERRTSWLVPVLGACLVLLVIVIGIVFFTGDDGDSDDATSATSQAEAPAETSGPAATEAPATQAPTPTQVSASTDTTGAETVPTTAPSSSACSSFTEQTELPIQLCDSGDLVRAAQEGLSAWSSQTGDAVGEVTVDVDGFFGPQTDTAVRTFQTIRALAVDGIIGPNTWAELCPFTNLNCE